MTNELTPKVYEIDYSFLIKNYLSPELWDKTWTLFVYRNIKVTLEMDYINVRRPRRLTFRLTIIENTYSTNKYISYDMENSNFEVLKKQINGGIRDLINSLEQHCIKKEDGYSQLCDSLTEERRRLEDIANSYLDENGISLRDVRDAYVDKFVSDNTKGWTYRDNYVAGRKYKCRPDVWLIYYNIIGDKTKIEAIQNILIKDSKFDDLLKEFREYNFVMEAEEDSETYNDYVDDMTLALEGI